MSPLLRGRQQNPVMNNHIGGNRTPALTTQALPCTLHKMSETTNDSTVGDEIENYVAGQLSSNVSPSAADTEFSTSSSPANHAAALGHDHLGTHYLTVGRFLENYEEPRDK